MPSRASSEGSLIAALAEDVGCVYFLSRSPRRLQKGLNERRIHLSLLLQLNVLADSR